MKNFLLISSIALLLISCKSKDLTALKGTWTDKETEITEIKVHETNGTHWLEFYNEKFEISEDRTVVIENKELTLNLKESPKVLMLDEQEFIPKEESLKLKFVGSWQGPEDTTFEISLVNGGLTWIVKNPSRSERYFPKRIENGYTFTYQDEDVQFFYVEDCILDSKGTRYCKA